MDTKEFIERAAKQHGSAYTYARTAYENSKTRVTVTCKKHGDIQVLPANFLRGHGCARCAGNVQMTTEDFVREAKQVHGDTYDYSSTVYTGTQTNVIICCREHGAFKQLPSNHLRGATCGYCATKIRAAKLSAASRASFISKAEKVHEGKGYDYSQVVYISNKTPVKVVCPTHGVWEPLPSNHLRGSGCFSCGIKRTTAAKHDSLRTFVAKARMAHGDFYSYAKTVYINSQVTCSVTCPTHGDFEIEPYSHVQGVGCAKCAFDRNSKAKRLTQEEFVQQASEAVPSVNFDAVQYNGGKSKLALTCPKHGTFWKTPGHIFRGCPACNCTSTDEQELADWVRGLGLRIEQRNRTLIGPLEIDIVVPELKLGIEYNGDYWHSLPIFEEDERKKLCHRIKSENMRRKGYRLLFVWESDWKNRQNTVKHWLHHQLRVDPKICGARECTLQDVSHKEASAFYDAHHLQGACASNSQHFGLVNGDETVAVMSFTTAASDRKTKSEPGVLWLVRFALAGAIPGAATKLFRHACRELAAKQVHTYSDRTYASGAVYETMGFVQHSTLPPDYRVWHPYYGIKHKSFWQRCNIPARLQELGFEQTYDAEQDARTAFEMCDLMRCRHVWDAGKIRWQWSAP